MEFVRLRREDEGHLFLTDISVADRIIDRLRLMFVAARPLAAFGRP
jgi:hypothetical protein